MELTPERQYNDVEMREVGEDDAQDEDEDDDPVGCVTCGEDFPTMQAYVVHACASASSEASTKRGKASPEVRGEEEDAMDTAGGGEASTGSDREQSFAARPASNLHDAESFIGKIVYNPDGSAYVIEGGDSDDADLDLLEVPKVEGAIVDRHGAGTSPAPPIPQIASAVFVPRPSSAWCRAINNVCPDTHGAQPDGAPTMHSFRVYNVRSPQGGSDGGGGRGDVDGGQKPRLPTKPILMCFICKLSFGLPLSFVSHAREEHALELQEEERTILGRPKASAILQGVGKEKTPLLSFLEPLHSPSSPQSGPASSSSSSSSPLAPASFFQPSGASTPTPKAASAATHVKYMYTSPLVSKDVAHGPGSAGQELSSEEASSSKPTSEPWLPWASDSSMKGFREDEEKAAERDDPRPFSANLDLFGSRGAGGGGREERGGAGTTRTSEASPAGVSTDNGSVSVKVEPSFSAPQDLSPQDCVPPSSTPVSLFSATHFSLLAGGTCDEHPLGRVQGTECPKCDMVLGSSQSLGGHMTMMHSRNSCKTLKCPKCNWHYKYQETLEIHMKEKHPDNDAQCMYCLTNQAHPRLARGETYSCGYKPYRCNACNYSTTTKGNLSIHMQSDKHMNNVQELANGGADMAVNPAPNHSQAQPKGPFSTAAAVGEDPLKKLKPKQSWRCDVCNYETLVARNLRIHMTSEKHTHNMMVLQQNMKHMQRDMQLQMGQLMLMGQQDPLFSMTPGALPPNMYPPYDQSLMVGGAPPLYDLAVSMGRENGALIGGGEEGGGGVGSGGGDTVDASMLFQCTVCELHSTDSLDSLHQHLNLDRTKQRESENISVQGGTYTCHMCQYKTGLKANFQLHCKTDKHLQKLQMTNHIREGGPGNEWRLGYLGASNPTQVRCNACGFYTSSVHKLQLHATQLSHENNAHVFRLLQLALARLQSGSSSGAVSPLSRYYYRCVLCACNTRTKQAMVRHTMSMKHLQQAQAKHLALDTRDVYVAILLREGETVAFEESGESARPPSLPPSLPAFLPPSLPPALLPSLHSDRFPAYLLPG